MDPETWTAIAAVAAAISAGLAAWATCQASRQAALGERSAEAAVILEITKSWNEIYGAYRELKASPVQVQPVIQAATQFDEYATTPDWNRMRPVFAFYEFLGAAIRTGYVRETTLFALVTVDTELWDRYRPLIDHFRHQRPDLYTGWQHLTARRKLYEPGKEHMPLAARKWFGKSRLSADE